MNQLHGLQSILNKLPVSFQTYPVILHVNLDRSVRDLHLYKSQDGKNGVTATARGVGGSARGCGRPKKSAVTPSCEVRLLRRTQCALCFPTQNGFFRTFPKICNWFRRAATHQSSPSHNPLRCPTLAVPTFMELSFNTSDQVSPQIDAASRVPHMLRQSLASLPFSSYHQEDKRRSTCGHRHIRAPLTHPTLQSQSVHPRDFRRFVPSSSWIPASSTLLTPTW